MNNNSAPEKQSHIFGGRVVAEAGGDRYYRLNDQRTLKWLSCKVCHFCCLTADFCR